MPDQTPDHTTAPAPAAHQCFTAKLHPSGDGNPRAHIYHQTAPVRRENRTTISLRVPLMTIADEIAAPLDVAKRIAEILNAHWDTHGEPDPKTQNPGHPGLDPGSSMICGPYDTLIRDLEALSSINSVPHSVPHSVAGTIARAALALRSYRRASLADDLTIAFRAAKVEEISSGLAGSKLLLSWHEKAGADLANHVLGVVKEKP